MSVSRTVAPTRWQDRSKRTPKAGLHLLEPERYFSNCHPASSWTNGPSPDIGNRHSRIIPPRPGFAPPPAADSVGIRPLCPRNTADSGAERLQVLALVVQLHAVRKRGPYGRTRDEFRTARTEHFRIVERSSAGLDYIILWPIVHTIDLRVEEQARSASSAKGTDEGCVAFGSRP
jgi:hypothetical protein